MSGLRKLLAECDPVAREPGMNDADVQAMRRTILVEARLRPAAAFWPRPLMLAAALAACLVVGITVGRRMGNSVSSVGVPPAGAPAFRDVRRQLQITSPGGTRIIWTFHQELDL